MKRILPITALALLLTGVVVGGMRAKHPANASRATLRSPGQVVRLRLIVDGKELARISTPDRVMATMRREGGEAIGLMPSVEIDGIGLSVLVQDETTGQFVEVGRYSLARNVPIDVSTSRTALSVEWLETTANTAPGGGASNAPCTVCCITCENITLCACEVTTSCGHCCCKDTCVCTGGNA